MPDLIDIQESERKLGRKKFSFNSIVSRDEAKQSMSTLPNSFGKRFSIIEKSNTNVMNSIERKKYFYN